MDARVPSFPLLVPGPWRSPGEVIDLLTRADVGVTEPGSGALAAGAVELSLVDDPAVGHEVLRSGPGLPVELARCSRAALIEIGASLDATLLPLLGELGRALRAAGGVALRMERSGRAFAWDAWLARVDRGHPVDRYELGVSLARDEDGFLFTVGMHHFDLPDAQIAAGADPAAAARILHALNMFQLVEDPVLASGHTFSPDAATPRRNLERWPDHRHPSGDGRANPFGLWRLLEPGAKSIAPRGRLAPVLMPSLVAVLMARSRELGRPLTPGEVRSIRDGAIAMTMDLAQQRAMERARGYADIEPELAVEQWEIVRAMQSS